MKEMSKLNILEKLKSDIFLIAGDASPRKFFRFRNNKKHILVYCEKDKRNNLENYIKINNFLIKKKIKVPKIIKKNIKKNFIIIEDFGNKLLKNQIENNVKKINFFKKIIDELIRLQNIKLSKILPKYSMILLTKELNLFYDWYLPEFFSKKKIRKIKRDINSILINYLKKTVKLNNVFVHRDFHIENLILHKSKIGFLDTQDAVIGHAAYDLMSLVDDVRINLNKNEQEKIYNYYVNRVKNIDKDFDFHFHILSLQRLLKILGIFVRLFRRDEKKKYLKFIGRTWKLIDLRLNYKEFKFLKLSFDKYFTKKIKNKKWK